MVRKNWQGDPCAPQEFVWDGIGCSYNDTGSPRIVSMYVYNLKTAPHLIKFNFDCDNLLKVDLKSGTCQPVD